jgi:hypothetical protein
LLRLFDQDGGEPWPARPVPGAAWHVNITPDARLIVAAYADGTIRWHRVSDGQQVLALFMHPDGQRWVAWTPQGYYNASLGGDDLIGWHVNHGYDRVSEALVEELRGAAARPDLAAISISDLEGYVSRRVRDLTEGSQRPVMAMPHTVEDYWIARRLNEPLAQPGAGMLLCPRVSATHSCRRSGRPVRAPHRGAVPRYRRTGRAGIGWAADHPDRRPIAPDGRAFRQPHRTPAGRARSERPGGASPPPGRPRRPASRPPAQGLRLARPARAASGCRRRATAAPADRSGNGGADCRCPAGGPHPAPALPDARGAPAAGPAHPAAAAPRAAAASARFIRPGAPGCRAATTAADAAPAGDEVDAALPPPGLPPAISGLSAPRTRSPILLQIQNIAARERA